MKRILVLLVGACVLATMTACPNVKTPQSPSPSGPVVEGDECEHWYATAKTKDGVVVECDQGTIDTRLRWRRYGPENHPHG